MRSNDSCMTIGSTDTPARRPYDEKMMSSDRRKAIIGASKITPREVKGSSSEVTLGSDNGNVATPCQQPKVENVIPDGTVLTVLYDFEGTEEGIIYIMYYFINICIYYIIYKIP